MSIGRLDDECGVNSDTHASGPKPCRDDGLGALEDGEEEEGRAVGGAEEGNIGLSRSRPEDRGMRRPASLSDSDRLRFLDVPELGERRGERERACDVGGDGSAWL